MKPTGSDLRIFYKTFETMFERKTGTQFEWMTGEKAKFITGYIRMCEAMRVRDTSRIGEMTSAYLSHLDKQIDAWWKWSKATRFNLMGFLINVDSIELFAKKKLTPSLEITANGLGVVGTETQSEWEL